jgi:hypothetical protein
MVEHGRTQNAERQPAVMQHRERQPNDSVGIDSPPDTAGLAATPHDRQVPGRNGAGDDQERRAAHLAAERIRPGQRRAAARLQLDQRGDEAGRDQDDPGQRDPRDRRQARERAPDQHCHQQQGAGTGGEPDGSPGDVADGDGGAHAQTRWNLVDQTHR